MSLPSTIPQRLQRLDRATNQLERLSLLKTIAGQLTSSHPEEALTYLETGLTLSEHLNKRHEQAWYIKQSGLCHEALGELHRARDAYVNALKIYVDIDDREEQCEINLKLGELALSENKVQTAVQAFNEALLIYRDQKDLPNQIHTLKRLGNVYDQIGDHSTALEYRHGCVRAAEELKEDRTLGIIYCDLAITNSHLDKHSRSLEHFCRALELFRTAGDHTLEVRTLSNLTNAYAQCGNTEAALQCGAKALTIYDALGDQNGLGTTLLSLSNIHEEQGNIDECHDMRIKARDLFEGTGNLQGECSAMLALGSLYQKMNNHHYAIHVLEHCTLTAQELGDPEREYAAHELLARSYEAVGDDRRALQSMKRWTSLYNKARGHQEEKHVTELHARFDLERAQKDREILRLKNNELQADMQRKTAEFTSLMLRMLEKSRLLNEIQEIIAEVANEVDAPFKKSLDEVSAKIKGSHDSEQDWKAFEQQFAQVYGDFLPRLLARYPKLTPTESRVCALIRTGLTSAEVAALMHLEKKSISTYRTRIRKTIGITPQDNLTNFLKSL